MIEVPAYIVTVIIGAIALALSYVVSEIDRKKIRDMYKDKKPKVKK